MIIVDLLVSPNRFSFENPYDYTFRESKAPHVAMKRLSSIITQPYVPCGGELSRMENGKGRGWLFHLGMDATENEALPCPSRQVHYIFLMSSDL
jgi:hypothetical protein